MRKQITTALTMTMILSMAAAGPAYGGSWRMEQSGWRYQKDDGRDASGEWLQDGEKWYLFDGQGNMRTGWFQDEAGRWFYFNPGGDMSAGWQWIDEPATISIPLQTVCRE